MSDDFEPEQGSVIVRRFTDSLVPCDTLSVGTNVAQVVRQADLEARDKMRTRMLYNKIDKGSR